METHSFYAKLSANVFLSDEDFYFIYKCFQNHYDRTIKMSADVGGFLYGRKVHRTPYPDWTPTDEDRVIEFSSRELQLVLKSLEMQSSKQASDLNIRFLQILSELAKNQNEINNNLIK